MVLPIDFSPGLKTTWGLSVSRGNGPAVVLTGAVSRAGWRERPTVVLAHEAFHRPFLAIHQRISPELAQCWEALMPPAL